MRLIDTPLLVLLALALGVRLLLMPLPDPFPADLTTFWVPWMNHGARHGLVDLYLQGDPPVNYPPLYLTLLTGLGALYRLFDAALQPSAWQRVLIKLPAVLADLAIVVLLYGTVRLFAGATGGTGRAAREADGGRTGTAFPLPPTALPILVAALWAFNPAAIYVSAYWGQVNSIHTLWMLAALLAALTANWILAGVLMALALLTKLQAIVILPLLAFLAWRAGVRGLLKGALALVATLALGFLPFIVNGAAAPLLAVYRGSVGFYNQLTLNAYNLWWLPYGLVEQLTGRQLTDDISLLGPVTPRWIGLALMGAFTLLVLWALYRWDRRQGPRGRVRDSAPSSISSLPRSLSLPFFAAGLLLFAFFMLPTEIHERYILPALAFLAVVAWRDRRLLAAYLLLTLMVFLNLLEVLPFARWFWELLIAIPGERLLIALVNVALFAYFTRRYLQDTAPPARPPVMEDAIAA